MWLGFGCFGQSKMEIVVNANWQLFEGPGLRAICRSCRVVPALQTRSYLISMQDVQPCDETWSAPVM